MQVIDGSSKLWSEEPDKAALRKRTSFIAGDFFKSGALRVCFAFRKAHCCALRPRINMQLTGGDMCHVLSCHVTAALLMPAPLPLRA